VVIVAGCGGDLLDKLFNLPRHVLSEVRRPFSPGQGFATDQQIRPCSIRDDLGLLIRLKIKHDSVVPKEHSKLLQPRTTATARGELVKFVFETALPRAQRIR
jgi:hypothetical protein